MKISKIKYEETNTYKLLGQDIETVTQEKDIGVIIDSEIFWYHQQISMSPIQQCLVDHLYIYNKENWA
jgi:hypothetical protein